MLPTRVSRCFLCFPFGNGHFYEAPDPFIFLVSPTCRRFLRNLSDRVSPICTGIFAFWAHFRVRICNCVCQFQFPGESFLKKSRGEGNGHIVRFIKIDEKTWGSNFGFENFFPLKTPFEHLSSPSEWAAKNSVLGVKKPTAQNSTKPQPTRLGSSRNTIHSSGLACVGARGALWVGLLRVLGIKPH